MLNLDLTSTKFSRPTNFDYVARPAPFFIVVSGKGYGGCSGRRCGGKFPGNYLSLARRGPAAFKPRFFWLAKLEIWFLLSSPPAAAPGTVPAQPAGQPPAASSNWYM